MDKLPTKILLYIANKLEIKHKLLCRLVCKKIYHAMNIVLPNRKLPDYIYWYYHIICDSEISHNKIKSDLQYIELPTSYKYKECNIQNYNNICSSRLSAVGCISSYKCIKCQLQLYLIYLHRKSLLDLRDPYIAKVYFCTGCKQIPIN